jgi:GT2 family glycosyltransferase
MGIAVGSNTALELADGEFVGFLDHDDILYSDALLEVVKLLNQDQTLDYIYSDQDKIDIQGKRVEPLFKPDWSPDLLISINYVTHFSVYRGNLLRSLKLREGYAGCEDLDLALRATERTDKIGHIRRPLYGWRKYPTLVSASDSLNPPGIVTALRAIQDAMDRRGLEATVKMLPKPVTYRVRYVIKGRPSVTIIIPVNRTKYIVNCVRSILEKTAHKDYEILIVDNGIGIDLLKTLPASDKVRIHHDPSVFNVSRMINQAAKLSRGEYLVILNDGTEVINEEWLTAMLEYAQRQDVGAVGAKLLLPNGTVQHAGVILTDDGAINYGGMRASDPGYFNFACMVRNCAAVTGTCMMVRKTYFEELGGFDESFALSGNDVDFCIRLLQKKLWVIYTPYALLRHYCEGTRSLIDVNAQEKQRFREKHREFIARGDPFYNPNLSTEVPYAIRKSKESPRAD